MDLVGIVCPHLPDGSLNSWLRAIDFVLSAFEISQGYSDFQGIFFFQNYQSNLLVTVT